MIMDDHSYISPPGDTIQETMEFFGLKKERFAFLIGKPVEFIERLILGDIEIDNKLAIELECVLGIPREFWLERERLYREAIKRLGE